MNIRQVSKKEFKGLLKKLDKYIIPDRFGKSKDVKSIRIKDKELFLVNDEPIFIKVDERVIPFIGNDWLVKQLPQVVVDKGAVPYLSNGADVMVPGIVSYSKFEKDDVVNVVVEEYMVPLVIGVSLLSSSELDNIKKGKAIKNLHYKGDEIWQYVKE
jgi:PUA domain protein